MNENTTLDKNEVVQVNVRDNYLWVTFADGRLLATPLHWFPFLQLATPEQRQQYDIVPYAIYWNELGEGVMIEGLLEGRKTPFGFTEYKRRVAELTEDIEADKVNAKPKEVL